MNQQQTVEEICKLLRGFTGRRDEQRILDLLAACEGPSLDLVLQEVNVRKVISNLHNRRRGPDNRTRLLQFLTVERVHDLSLKTRVDIVWSLQKGATHRWLESSIRNIILASSGEELRHLRNELNNSDSFHDLSRLVFSDIDDSVIRAEILDHIAAHQVPTDEIKVLSDIDDTVFARLHDRRYPPKTLYPGVLAFFKALDQVPDGTGVAGDLTFVTARPGLFGGLVAWWTRRSLRAAGIRLHTILTGSLLALRSHRRMAERKIRNIRRYNQIFPEYGLVFVGDSGQGDVQVGRQILLELAEATRGVFIHDVTQVSLNPPDGHEEDELVFFGTYIAAATAAWQRGVLTSAQALEVAETAMEDVQAIVALTPQARKDRIGEHQRDLDILREMIASENTAQS